MLKYTNYDIVFQEIPDETTLAINLSNCPWKCKGCHSSELWEDVGEELTWNIIKELIAKYPDITCVCFMGGDVNPSRVWMFAANIRRHYDKKYKLAWYTGWNKFPKLECENIYGNPFDYIKTGQYMEEFGPLNSPTTNQRLYQYSELSSDYTINKGWKDITYKFWKND